MSRVRLDKLLCDRGLADSRGRAQALVLAGKVRVNGHIAQKAGTQVAPDAAVELLEDDHPYVSRGALKLLEALDTWPIDPAGKACLDVGASTGGFTDVLLRRGARRVYAIDVGYGQLAWPLRQDERVVVLERENIRHLDPRRVPEACELAVIDVSFISLLLVLPKVRELIGSGGKDVVALVKPQFEVGKGEVGKGGVVRDEAQRLACVQKVSDWARKNGFDVVGHVASPITGPAGNVEYLLYLKTRA